jgi:Phage tail sheath protein subtilisin-like domain/Phage tail sheath C-terminal domain
MPLNLASPGIVVREVDLTLGRTQPASDKIGAIVAPFAKGPVDLPILIQNENELLNNFGESYTTDKHYENWLSASSYLAYGGALRVVRANDNDLRNGFVGTASSVKIDSLDHYISLGYDDNTLTNVTVAAKNPGSWSNGISVAIIDSKVDQILSGINTLAGVGTALQVGYGVTQSAIGKVNVGIGTTSALDGYIKGIITEIGSSQIGVKVLSHVSAAGTETLKDYTPFGVYSFETLGSLGIHTNSQTTSYGSTTYTSRLDWFDQQTIKLTGVGQTTGTTINWNNVSPRPGTSSYASARNSRFDEVHLVVIDSEGKITGNSGSILEKHLGLSKASDAEFSVGSSSYWRKYLENNSDYIFGLNSPTGIVTTGYSSGFTLSSDIAWNQNAEGVIFAASGSSTNALSGGLDYSGIATITTAGSLTATIAELSDGYSLFETPENYKVDFLIMGSAAYSQSSAQALAQKLIAVAELRKDAIAFISPYRGAALTDTTTQTSATINSTDTITNNVISFYSALQSSSYAVFDSGYKYMYDRFSDTFRYVPLNGDIAGICARNDINNFPWYSPAGTSRGSILNAVKLAYNPSKTERDRLYSNRINSVIFSPGAGIILFGDKTGFAKASAFDRINVRRLFIYLEDTISRASRDVLFEFNDELTRTNFVNTIEPFLRDVQAKRGIFDYVVVCDETNNTAAVIDANEFRADIYIKPARSINFIGLTFIATKTGVDFEEVIGNF